jgi:hypothetical protein
MNVATTIKAVESVPWVANEAMHRMSGTHICLRFGWLWMPLIGDLGRSAFPLR